LERTRFNAAGSIFSEEGDDDADEQWSRESGAFSGRHIERSQVSSLPPKVISISGSGADQIDQRSTQVRKEFPSRSGDTTSSYEDSDSHLSDASSQKAATPVAGPTVTDTVEAAPDAQQSVIELHATKGAEASGSQDGQPTSGSHVRRLALLRNARRHSSDHIDEGELVSTPAAQDAGPVSSIPKPSRVRAHLATAHASELVSADAMATPATTSAENMAQATHEVAPRTSAHAPSHASLQASRQPTPRRATAPPTLPAPPTPPPANDELAIAAQMSRFLKPQSESSRSSTFDGQSQGLQSNPASEHKYTLDSGHRTPSASQQPAPPRFSPAEQPAARRAGQPVLAPKSSAFSRRQNDARRRDELSRAYAHPTNSSRGSKLPRVAPDLRSRHGRQNDDKTRVRKHGVRDATDGTSVAVDATDDVTDDMRGVAVQMSRFLKAPDPKASIDASQGRSRYVGSDGGGGGGGRAAAAAAASGVATRSSGIRQALADSLSHKAFPAHAHQSAYDSRPLPQPRPTAPGQLPAVQAGIRAKPAAHAGSSANLNCHRHNIGPPHQHFQDGGFTASSQLHGQRGSLPSVQRAQRASAARGAHLAPACNDLGVEPLKQLESQLIFTNQLLQEQQFVLASQAEAVSSCMQQLQRAYGREPLPALSPIHGNNAGNVSSVGQLLSN